MKALAMEGAGVLAVFESAERAEAAVGALRGAGFGAARLSVIGKDIALGPVAAQLDAGRSGLLAVLMRAGMSAGAAATYEAAVRGGQILVLVHGTAKDLQKARSVLRESQKCMQP
jgi:hypothetical protein